MDDTFSIYHRVLGLFGVSIYAQRNWDSRLWLSLQVVNVFVGFLVFVFTTAFVIDNASDLPIFIDGACIWTTGVIMFVSVLICLKSRADFRHLLVEMVFKDAAREIPFVEYVVDMKAGGQVLMDLKELVLGSQKRFLTMSGLLMKVYLISVFVTAALYMSGTVYEMMVSEDDAVRLLAFDMRFPWGLTDIRVYIASFTFNVYAACLCCIACPGFQCTVTILIVQIIRQLKILTFTLKHLDAIALEITGAGQPQRWQECCTAILSQCVRHYMQMKKVGNKVNRICRPFYLTMILDAIMLVCVCSVKIATSKKLSLEVMKYYIHETCFVMFVLMFCFLGQELQNQCLKLDQCVFEKWYIYDRRHKSHLRIFKMATDQGMSAHIFGSITLSLPTFTWFLKTGMSFFTLMMSFLEENN